MSPPTRRKAGAKGMIEPRAGNAPERPKVPKVPKVPRARRHDEVGV